MNNSVPLRQHVEIPGELYGEGMFVNPDVLERTCKNTIETVLLCLNCATKGTIYLIGPLPELRAVRITSGIRDGRGIRWGLPEISDYNLPGKTWEKYRDYPGQVLEAMGWCVEKQKSWTVENPLQDARSVRRQLFGEAEDFFHLEPVLLKKADLYGSKAANLPFPLDWQGNPIWQETKFVVAAVIKIHFLPGTIRRGDPATKIIKKLSRTLGTELLSIHVREMYLKSQEKLSRERLRTVNALAHELRNTLTKMGIVFSLINTVISFLREQWELEFGKAFPSFEDKQSILLKLNHLLDSACPQIEGQDQPARLAELLAAEQIQLSEEFLLPYQSELWIQTKLRPKWSFLSKVCASVGEREEEVAELLKNLEISVREVIKSELVQEVKQIPEEVRASWLRFAYTRFAAHNLDSLDQILLFLDHPAVKLSHKRQIKKMLNNLKVLAQVISTVEERANNMLVSLENEIPRTKSGPETHPPDKEETAASTG